MLLYKLRWQAHDFKKEVTILPSMAFYSWRLFCHHHTCVLILPHLLQFLAVMLWCMDRAPALKCNSYRLESWLVGQLKKASVHWKGPGM